MAPAVAVTDHPANRLDVDVLAEIVAGLARAEALWRPHVAHDPDERVRRRLLATPAYEVWLLGWTPHQPRSRTAAAPVSSLAPSGYQVLLAFEHP